MHFIDKRRTSIASFSMKRSVYPSICIIGGCILTRMYMRHQFQAFEIRGRHFCRGGGCSSIHHLRNIPNFTKSICVPNFMSGYGFPLIICHRIHFVFEENNSPTFLMQAKRSAYPRLCDSICIGIFRSSGQINSKNDISSIAVCTPL